MSEAVSPPVYLDTLKVGDSARSGPIVMVEADMIRFAREFDPQPMHIDPVAAAQGRFGGLIASGLHIIALVMRDLVDAQPFGEAEIVGLGIDALQFLHPVRPGDVLIARREIIAIIPSRSKPDRATLKAQMTVTNQDDVSVLSYIGLTQIPRRAERTIAS